MQLLIATALGAIAASLALPEPVFAALAFLWIMGFASATHDVAVDGVFMAATSSRQQAKYAGFQGMCWNIGSVLASGVLVTTSGWLHEKFSLSWVHAWMIMMVLSASMVLLASMYHTVVVPADIPSPIKHLRPGQRIAEAWISFAAKDKIVPMIIFVFLYRVGEVLIDKIGPLFLLDSPSAGGLGLNNQVHGLLYGTLGTIAFIAGTFLASALVMKFTLRRTLVALTLAMNIPHITYLLLSKFDVTEIGVIATAVCIEKFGFGMGSVGQLLYMVQQVAPGRYRMTHYAFATAIMASTHWVMGSLSGVLFDLCHRNYDLFFYAAFAISLVPIAAVRFAPFPAASNVS
jgi:PAT family beta-lactamase induction signal transducer AmpG